MTAADLMKFEPQRRYATLVALVVEGTATVTDEIIDLHDRIVGKLFNAAKNKHQEQFQSAGKAINDKIRLYGQIGQALLEAKQNGGDPFVAIEAVISWDDFAMHAAPAAKPVLGAINLLREMNASNARKLPEDAPTEFVRRRWDKLVLTEDGIDRRYYELCAMSELKNALRSGDIWVEGSRQFKNFNEYLLPAGKFTALKLAKELPLAIDTECESYLHARLSLLDSSGCRKVSAARHDCTSWPQSLGREARLHRLATKSRPRGTTARVGHKV